MKNETIKRWTAGLWGGAALCWVVVLFVVLVMSMAQGCGTVRSIGRAVSEVGQGLGEDMEMIADGVQNQIRDN